MSHFCISFLFSFYQAKVDSFDQIVDPDKGLAIFTTVSPDKKYTSTCGQTRVGV